MRSHQWDVVALGKGIYEIGGINFVDGGTEERKPGHKGQHEQKCGRPISETVLPYLAD